MKTNLKFQSLFAAVTISGVVASAAVALTPPTIVGSPTSTPMQPSVGQPTVGQPSVAPSSQAPTVTAQRGFSCNTASGTPQTVYQNSKGEQRVWINWVSTTFSESGFTPQVRCQKVSQKLQEFFASNQLKIISVGKKNKLNILCVASTPGNCLQDGQIYTLKPGQDPAKTLQQFVVLQTTPGGAPALLESESGDEVPFINVTQFIQEDAAPTTTPTNVNNQLQRPANSSTPGFGGLD